ALAAAIDELDRRGSSDDRLTRRATHGPAPLSFAQERLWFLEQLHPATATYNLPSAVRLRGGVDVARLQRALGEIVRRHEALRTTFRAEAGRPVQVVAAPSPLPLPVTDLRALDAGE